MRTVFRITTSITATLGFAALLLSVAAAVDAPQVRVNGERLEGQWVPGSKSVAAFKGIPFAAAPVGELRWRAPQPHTPRKGLQKAIEFALACMQGPHIVNWYAGVAEVFGYGLDDVGKPNGVSEDCLYLNIWTPALDASRSGESFPVFVWFHGGSNKAGWSYEPNYIGAELAKRGLVVVTVTYRLGPFGFFSHSSFGDGGGEEPIANFGWLDQVVALEWIQANIDAFGGDPGNVTCAGESSGAGDLANFIAADQVTGLCRRNLGQSPGGSYLERATLADAQAEGLRIASELGIADDANAVEQLRAVSADDLLAAADRALPGHYYDVVADGKTIIEAPLESLSREQQSNIDFLLGTNRDEWYMYIAEETDWDDIDRWLAEIAPNDAAVLRAQVADETDPRRALDRLRTAYEMSCAVRRVAARITATGGRAWVYYFTRQRPGPGGEKLGAYHGTEIPYVFGTHDDWLPTEQLDWQLTDAVMDYWAQFARTGDPNLPGRPEWPLYRAEKPAVLELGEQIQTVPPFDAALCIWLGPD